LKRKDFAFQDAKFLLPEKQSPFRASRCIYRIICSRRFFAASDHVQKDALLFAKRRSSFSKTKRFLFKNERLLFPHPPQQNHKSFKIKTLQFHRLSAPFSPPKSPTSSPKSA